jgi:hypothetical protein
MNQQLFPELPAQERGAALEGIAHKSETQKVRRFHTVEEKDQMKDFISTESISLMDKKEEFAEIRKDFNKAASDLGKAITGALKDLRRGYTDNEETVFLVPDHDEDLMYIYDSKGQLIQSRKMYPDERQTKLIDMPATGTHNS